MSTEEKAVAGSSDRPPRARTRTMAAIGIALLALFLILLAVGVIPRVRNNRALAIGAEDVRNAVPAVQVLQPTAAAEAGLTLAATTQAIQDSIIYARTSGYLKRRFVDIGDRVKAGQLLAEIESPEVDAQLRQAQANLLQAQKTLDLQIANRDLAKVTMDRYVAADAEKAVAVEAVDQSVATLPHGPGVRRRGRGHGRVESRHRSAVHGPDVVSARGRAVQRHGHPAERGRGRVDYGRQPHRQHRRGADRISQARRTGCSRSRQIDKLRVFVNVPQAFAPNVRAGLPVNVRVRGHLDKPVAASVTRTASALDPGTRTLLTQVEIPNPSGQLMPGMFVYVDFQIAPSGTRWRVPATAVVFDTQGTRVATVAQGNTIRFQHVELGRDFGDSIDIQAGLHGNETIVAQPTVSLKEGQVVKPMASQKTP